MVAGAVIVSGACAVARESDGPIGSAVDAALDAVGLKDSTAVSDVKAEDATTAGWTSTTAKCVTAMPLPEARAAFADRSAADLVRSTAMLCDGAEGWCYQATLYAKPGELRATCPSAGIDVTFLVPPRL